MSSNQGGEWLLQFLYDNGLRGETLKRLWAIGMRESGGNPKVDNRGTNSNGSIDYGLYQINDKAHADAIRRKFGWSMEDMRDPDKNLKVMLWMSKQGQDLSAWGVSNPDGSVTGWAASIGDAQRKKFEQAMFSHMREFDGVAKKVGVDPGDGIRMVEGGKDGKPLDSTGQPVAKNPKKIASRFGANYAFIQSDPQMAKWFSNFAKRYIASAGKISYETFKAEFDQLPIVRNNSAEWLADWELEHANPEVYAQAVARDVETLRDQAAAIGAVVDDDTLMEIAKRSRRMSLNPSQVNNLLAGNINADNAIGQAEKDVEELKQWADRNGLQLTPDAINKYVQSIGAGDLSIDDVKQDLRKTYLSGTYLAWSDKINAGQDPFDLAQPYMGLGSNILEKPVDLNDPTMKQIMQGIGPDGKPRITPMWEAEQMFRARPEWQTTDNAYATYSNVGMNILRTFGFA